MAAQYEAMCKRMHHGFSARNGLYAAILAAGGYTGIKRVFEREYGGFLSTFGEGHAPDASQITDGLGERWEVERIVIKPYAAMGGIHAPLDALSDVGAQRPLKANEIARIEVDRQMSRAIESPQSNAEVAAKYRALTDGLIDTQRQPRSRRW